MSCGVIAAALSLVAAARAAHSGVAGPAALLLLLPHDDAVRMLIVTGLAARRSAERGVT